MGLAEAYERDDIERDATMPRVGSEGGETTTDASCDTDTLEIDSDEDEW